MLNTFSKRPEYVPRMSRGCPLSVRGGSRNKLQILSECHVKDSWQDQLAFHEISKDISAPWGVREHPRDIRGISPQTRHAPCGDPFASPMSEGCSMDVSCSRSRFAWLPHKLSIFPNETCRHTSAGRFSKLPFLGASTNN